jgi:hypothetical protein
LKEKEDKKFYQLNETACAIGKLTLVNIEDFKKKIFFYPKELQITKTYSFKRLLKDNIMYHSLGWKSIFKR